MISVLRDISERGRELEQVLNQYITFVKPAFEEFCLPVRNFETFPPTGSLVFISVDIFCLLMQLKAKLTLSATFCLFFQTKKYADVIIPRGADNLGKGIYYSIHR